MATTILLGAILALIVGAFLLGRSYEAGGIPMPKLEDVDPWVARFREYRAGSRHESLATVYERWRWVCGYHPAVAAYVAQMGVRDPAYTPAPPGSAVS